MSDSERDTLLRAVGAAFDVGVELVRSIVAFAFETIQTLIATSAEYLKELKETVARAADTFGRHLSDITRSISDRLREQAQRVQTGVQTATASAWAYLPDMRGTRPAKDAVRPDGSARET